MSGSAEFPIIRSALRKGNGTAGALAVPVLGSLPLVPAWSYNAAKRGFFGSLSLQVSWCGISAKLLFHWALCPPNTGDMAMRSSASSSWATSSAVRITSAAPRFSRMRPSFREPGMGTM